MFRGIIFDFDGLIVDTETVWYEAFKEALFNSHSVELGLPGYANCIGTGNEVLYKHFREVVGNTVDCEQIENDALLIYTNKMQEPVLREGVKEYLEEAKSHNLIIGLASSSSKQWVTTYLEQLGIIQYFDVINTRDDVNKVKPHPELYVKTLKDCVLLPTETIAFEDSLNGLTAAKKAGIRCVIVPNDVTSNLPFNNHDYHLNSMKQESLEQVMKKLGRIV
jgi:putative hydrolase of the HAD superfamily